MIGRWLALVALVVIAAGAAVAPAARAQGDVENASFVDVFEDLSHSVVRLERCSSLTVSENPGGAQVGQFNTFRCDNGFGNGSGTIIDANGTILTNGHVALDDANEPLWMLVQTVADQDGGVQPAFIAEPVLYSPPDELDLAVLVPRYSIDGRPLAPGELSFTPLPPVRSADSIRTAEDVMTIGWPSAGNVTVTTGFGKVSGFLPQDDNPVTAELGGRAWIKTDAQILPGNSGGTMVDEHGAFIGVPTQVLFARSSESKDIMGVVGSARPALEGLELLKKRGTGSWDGSSGAAPSEAQAAVEFTVINQSTQQPLGGASVFLLRQGDTAEQYLRDQSSVQAVERGVTDATGRVRLQQPIERNQSYGVIVLAEGFLPNAFDAVLAPEGSGGVA
ncbi:MAG: S1 family peptidase [Thermomicrobiales bacterium]